MILVAGPPCGGKSTYVTSNAGPTDSTLDFDDIIERLTGERYSRDPDIVATAMAEWSDRLPTSDFVIWTAPLRRQRGGIRSRYGAKVVVVYADIDVCLQRAAEGRPAIWADLVRNWFRDFEQSRTGEMYVDTTGSAASPMAADW